MSDGREFPPGWDPGCVQRLLAHYEGISEEEQVAEDEEAAREQAGQARSPCRTICCRRSGNGS